MIKIPESPWQPEGVLMKKTEGAVESRILFTATTFFSNSSRLDFSERVSPNPTTTHLLSSGMLLGLGKSVF